MNRLSDKIKTFKEGCSVKVDKTIEESDILQFAELTGDFSPNHVDEDFMKESIYKKRIAHGALLVGYMSHASTLILEKFQPETSDATPVSLGYDRIRFIKPVFIDDKISITYTVAKFDNDAKRSFSNIEVKNQHDELVAVAVHILKWVPNSITS